MSKSTLILVSEMEEDRLFAIEVASSLGTAFELVSPGQLLATLDRLDDQCLVFLGISASNSGDQVKELLLPRIAAHANVPYSTIHPELVHVIGCLDVDDVGEFAQKGTFGSFIMRSEEDPKLAGRKYATLIRPMIERRIPLETRASEPVAETVESVCFDLKHSNDKHLALAVLENFMTKECGYPGAVRSKITTAVDELLMNAIYDAPPDSAGNQRLRATPRSMPIQMPDTHAVRLRVRADADSLSVTVTDCYGSLKRQKVLGHILRNYRALTYRIDPAAFGAGIGLAVTFRMGGSIFFSVSPGQKTEVTVTFPRSNSYRKIRAQYRFVAVQIDLI